MPTAKENRTLTIEGDLVRFHRTVIEREVRTSDFIAEIRTQVAEALNVPRSAQARINGDPADDEDTVPDGATIEFVKVAGEKGLVARP